jgi:predicted exporter
MSVVEHHDVVETGDTRTDTRVSSSRLVVSPGQVIAGILGLVMAVIGIVAVARRWHRQFDE